MVEARAFRQNYDASSGGKTKFDNDLSAVSDDSIIMITDGDGGSGSGSGSSSSGEEGGLKSKCNPLPPPPICDGEEVRRLRVKWQKKLIQQKSECAKLTRENVRLLEEKGKVEQALHALIEEHEATIDDLEQREEQVESLNQQLACGSSTELSPCCGDLNLQRLAGMISLCEQHAVPSPLPQPNDSAFAKKILESLNPASREAFREVLATMPRAGWSPAANSEDEKIGEAKKQRIIYVKKDDSDDEMMSTPYEAEAHVT